MGGTVVIKAQVHSGGRGKAGGVKLAKTPAEAAEHASRILGMKIKGLVVSRVLVVPAADIASEAYVGLITDRETQRPVFMVSPPGASTSRKSRPRRREKIFRLAVDPRYGLLRTGRSASHSSSTAVPEGARSREDQGTALACSWPTALLVESTRSSTTPGRRSTALDAKIWIDDNELSGAARPREPSRRKRRGAGGSRSPAGRAHLHRKLDGNVGCVVNGAGLGDGHDGPGQYYGGEPANFLDIGGSSNPDKVVNALRIITSDPAVKGILFNIFGGITRTDDVANGIKTALAQFPVKVPIVVPSPAI